MARVLLVDVSPSEGDLLAGYRSQQMNWSNRLLNWPRKVPHLLKSVLFSETTMVFLKLRESQEVRSSES
jgi:hypothetical protein